MAVHSFQSLLSHLATLTRNKVVSEATGLQFERLARSTPTQARALELLGVRL